jgi:hypothetical protein
MGDASFWFYLSRLCTGTNPFLTRVDGSPVSFPTSNFYDATFQEQVIVLSKEGQQARSGQTDWIRINRGIDRWLGGVHLQGPEAAWRWDIQQATLVQI